MIYPIADVSVLLSKRWANLLLRGWDVIDGDTIAVIRNRGDDMFDTRTIRIYGIDCPELHSQNPKEKSAAKMVRQCVEHWLDDADAGSLEFAEQGHDKYGRDIGEINCCQSGVPISLSGFLETLGCRVYLGDKKQLWESVELSTIEMHCEDYLSACQPMKSHTRVFAAIAKFADSLEDD